MKRMLLLGLALFGAVSNVDASCKSGETGAVLDPGATNNRLFTKIPAVPANPLNFPTNNIIVTTYNIQSGLSESCVSNLQDQATFLKDGHYMAFQEVDINTSHCHCDQPQTFANITGKTTNYLRTIYYQGGYYGHASGSVYPILESRYYMYKAYSSELRGLIAERTQPPALGGRDMWLVSTHFQYDSVSVRTMTAVELVNYCQGLASQFPNALIVVPGDYYVQYGDSDYATLRQYFNDAWVSYSGVQTGGSTWPSTGPALRFDYIWYKVPSGLQVKVANYQTLNTEDSDHVPLRVTFTVTSGGATSAPTGAPTNPPTGAPTNPPTGAPTNPPTDAPTNPPTSAPTNPPTGTVPGGTGSCQATYSTSVRTGGGWTTNGVKYAIQDIKIVNTGKCTVTEAKLTVPNQAGITDSWNYDKTTGEVKLYGVMPNQDYTGAGFTFDASKSYPTTQPVFSYSCFSCPGDVSSTSSSSGTATPAPTTAPTGTCGVSIEVTPRAGSSWDQDGKTYEIYDISASNHGTKPVTAVTVMVSSAGPITQTWNLDANGVSNQYKINLFGNAMQPGQTLVRTAGFIQGSTNPGSAGNAAFLITATC